MTFSAMRLLISREVERVATRKSLVFILRIDRTLYSVCTICRDPSVCQVVFARRIDAIEKRTSQSSLKRAALVTIAQIRTSLQAVAGFRIGATATQERARKVILNIARIV